eukprot:3333542-Pyramimonas_sp.AAC.1
MASEVTEYFSWASLIHERSGRDVCGGRRLRRSYWHSVDVVNRRTSWARVDCSAPGRRKINLAVG